MQASRGVHENGHTHLTAEFHHEVLSEFGPALVEIGSAAAVVGSETKTEAGRKRKRNNPSPNFSQHQEVPRHSASSDGGMDSCACMFKRRDYTAESRKFDLQESNSTIAVCQPAACQFTGTTLCLISTKSLVSMANTLFLLSESVILD